MNIFEYLNSFNFFLNFKLISSEEIIIIFLFYNFIKILIFGSLLELIWPTQFFNRRHSINNIKFRSFVEVLSKLKLNNNIYNIYNVFFIKYFFLSK